MYGNNYYVPQQRFQQPIMQQQIPTQQYIQSVQQPTTQMGLLGKVVDSIETVKAMDIPLDGSLSYFALADGSAIVTKQLQTDGTSKIIVYKPTKEDSDESHKFVTFEEMQKELVKIDLSDLEDLKDEIKDLKSELKDIQKKIKNKGE